MKCMTVIFFRTGVDEGPKDGETVVGVYGDGHIMALEYTADGWYSVDLSCEMAPPVWWFDAPKLENVS